MAIKLFFNQISIQNKQIVPNTSPIIFVANHPNFFMDPLIIGSYCPRQLYFFAKSTLFNSPLKKRILTRLNLVPVYRKIDDKENMGGNVNSFNKGYRILENNGAFLIFPEGISVGKRVLGKTKTILFLVIGSPLFIWGIITNSIPYILPRVLVEITNKDQSEEASWKLIYGFIFFVFYYAVSITFIWKLTQNIFLTILFISSLIPSGDFALYYSKNINKYKQHVKFLSIFYKKRSLIFEIIQRRIELLQFIEKSKNRYLQTIK